MILPLDNRHNTRILAYTMTTQTDKTAAQLHTVWIAACRATDRARKSVILANRTAAHPRATVTDWNRVHDAKTVWAAAQTAQETARAACESHRIATH